MKSETRALQPSLASSNRGRMGSRDQNLLQRIQERQANGVRQATLVLQRKREEKPLLARQQVEAVRFEGTGKVRNRRGSVSAAIAAGLLVLIAPNLGTAEPTRAPLAGQVEADNPFGFVEGKTRVGEIGAKLGAHGVGDLEWMLDTHTESGFVDLLVADGVKAIYSFGKGGLYLGRVLDIDNLADVDTSKAKSWTITVGYLGRTFVTAENLSVREKDGVLQPIIIMLSGAEQQERTVQTITLTPIIALEGGFKNPRLWRKGKLILLHAQKEDGTPWSNVYGFSGTTGKFLGAKPAGAELSMATER